MNLIQQALYEYIIDKDYNDKMLQYNALLDYLFEDLLVEASTDDTILQEILTCVFFDAYFNNKSKPFNNVEELVNWYNNKNDGQNIINDITTKINISKENFNKFFNGDQKWQKSFYNQVISMQSWLSKNKQFKNFNRYKFIHHDTHICIYLGKSYNDDTGITTSIITKKYYGTDKDKYQKADIYAVQNDIKELTPANTTEKEINIWKNAIENGSFVGISLKKLSKNPVSDIHTWGYDNITLDIDKNSAIDFKVGKDVTGLDIFNTKTIKEIISEKDIPNVTGVLEFTLLINNTPKIIDISIRSNGNGSEHAIKDPIVSFNTPFTSELKYANGDAQLGKAQTLVTNWVKNITDIVDINEFTDDNINTITKTKNKKTSVYEYKTKKISKFKTPTADDYNKKIKTIKGYFKNINGLLDDGSLGNANKIIQNISANIHNIVQLYANIQTYYYEADELEGSNDKSDLIVSSYYKKHFQDIKNSFEKIKGFSLQTITKNNINNFINNMRILYNLTKWYNVTWKLINNIEAIALHLGDEEHGCIQLFKAAKLSTLPYVSLD